MESLYKHAPIWNKLKERNLLEDDTCPWCNSATEIIRHILFECQCVQELWEESECDAMKEDGIEGDMKDVMVGWKRVDRWVDEHNMYGTTIYTMTVLAYQGSPKFGRLCLKGWLRLTRTCRWQFRDEWDWA
ncbi:putative helicase C15C4.05 [Bienertia sinuspersici]